MKFTKKIPYALKCAVPTAMLAAATMFGGCQKEENPKRDIELNFTATYGFELSESNIKNKLDDPTVNKIYLRLVDEGSCWYRPEHGWVYPEDVRQYLELRVNLAPDRIFGRGNFVFESGTCARADSLWFVGRGWTVNRQNQIPQKQR